jgi:uncharacterized membrane protein YvlD (DUF360 family)
MSTAGLLALAYPSPKLPHPDPNPSSLSVFHKNATLSVPGFSMTYAPSNILVIVDTIIRPIIRILLSPIPLCLCPLLSFPPSFFNPLSLRLGGIMILHNSPYCRFELYISSLTSLYFLSVVRPRRLTRVKTRPIFFSNIRNSANKDSFGFSAVNFASSDIYHQLTLRGRVELTRLILSPNLAYSHSTSCSRDESCSFDALVVSFPWSRIQSADDTPSWAVDGLTMGSPLLGTWL